MKLLDAIVAKLTGRQASSRPEVSNAVTYSDAVMESFGVSAAGTTVSATSAMRVSAVAACVAKISGARVTVTVMRMSSSAVKLSVKSRKLWMPRIKTSQEVYIKIVNYLNG